jgi:acetyl-CoA carboxylase biotin carboxyl carrier protein
VAGRAPLLGTFYRAPRPGAAPYVEVGDDVETDTVVGIIETMKLMNSVEAGVRGRVVEIRVANAAFADRDTVLMVVEPDGSST